MTIVLVRNTLTAFTVWNVMPRREYCKWYQYKSAYISLHLHPSSSDQFERIHPRKEKIHKASAMPSYTTILLSLGLLVATPLVDAASMTLRFPSSADGAATCYSFSGTEITGTTVDECFDNCVGK
jgi:hypothetical protein